MGGRIGSGNELLSGNSLLEKESTVLLCILTVNIQMTATTTTVLVVVDSMMMMMMMIMSHCTVS